jgi:hypothetical protein
MGITSRARIRRRGRGGILTANDDFALGAITTFAGVSVAAGLFTSWRLGRRGAAEIEDAIGWGIAASIIAGLAPLVLFLILYSALGGGR